MGGGALFSSFVGKEANTQGKEKSNEKFLS